MPEDRQSESATHSEKRWLTPSQALATPITSNDHFVEDLVDTETLDRHALETGGLCFVIDATTPCHVHKINTMDKLIYAPRHVIGLANIDSNIVPVFDLSIYFEFKPSSYNPSSFVLLVGESEQAIAFTLDKLPQRLTFQANQVLPPPPVNQRLMPFIKCSYQKPDTPSHETVPIDKNLSDQPLWLELDIEHLLLELKQSG